MFSMRVHFGCQWDELLINNYHNKWCPSRLPSAWHQRTVLPGAELPVSISVSRTATSSQACRARGWRCRCSTFAARTWSARGSPSRRKSPATRARRYSPGRCRRDAPWIGERWSCTLFIIVLRSWKFGEWRCSLFLLDVVFARYYYYYFIQSKCDNRWCLK